MIDIENVLRERENQFIEAKLADSKVPKSIWETYSAFANTFGGTIILGLKEDKTTKKLSVEGVKNPDQIISDIWNTLNNNSKVSSNILLSNHIYKIEYNNKTLVVINVPRASRSDRPVYVGEDFFKGTYRRNHEGDYHCNKTEVKSMLRDQSEVTSDSLLLDNVPITALNHDSIKRYRIIFKNLRPDHVWVELSNDEFLCKIGAARIFQSDGKLHPTLGGLIFFGDFIEIQNELPNFFLDYRERLDFNNRWTDRVCSGDADWSGNVFDFYFKVASKLTSEIKRPFALDNNMQRIDDTPLHKGVREALANALIHADYYGTRGVVIDKYPNSISISNPGSFRIPIFDAIGGGISDARNSKIFNMFALIEVGERSGMGLCNLCDVWRKNNLPTPYVKESLTPCERITVELQLNKNENNNFVEESNPGIYFTTNKPSSSLINNHSLTTLTAKENSIKATFNIPLSSSDHAFTTTHSQKEKKNISNKPTDSSLSQDFTTTQSKIISNNTSYNPSFSAFSQCLSTTQSKTDNCNISNNHATLSLPQSLSTTHSNKSDTNTSYNSTVSALPQDSSTTQSTKHLSIKDANSIEDLILKEILSYPQISHKKLSENLGRKQSSIRFYLERLQKKGIVSRIGSNRNGFWRINRK